MSQMKAKPIKKYPPSMTKQAFRDECDINKILKRAQKSGTISHLQKNEGFYGDFADFDFHEAQINLARGREIFDDLPSEIRKEFNQSPGEFFKFVNDPENSGELARVLPALAEPGRQNISARPPTADQERVALAREPQATENTTTEGEPSVTPTEPSVGP